MQTVKNKSLYVSAAVIIAVIFSVIPLFSTDGEQVGRIRDVNIRTGEITVESPEAAGKIMMGTKLYLRIDGKIVQMTATFPMQTVAKCRLVKGNAGYLKQIVKGALVYIYVAGVEKKDDKRNRFYLPSTKEVYEH